MPIIGLTDYVPPERTLPTLAVLRKGKPRTAKGQLARDADLDYFRVDWKPEFEFLADAFLAIYGKEPSEFGDVRILGETPDEALSAWWESWRSNGTLLHRCDGERQWAWFNEKLNRVVSHHERTRHEPCYCKTLPEGDRPCRRRGRLNIVLPQFTMETGVLGTFLVTTGSVHDIANLYANLTGVYNVYGPLQRLRFVLGRGPRKINVPMKDKETGQPTRGKVEKSLLYVYLEPEDVQKYLAQALDTAPLLPSQYDLETGEVMELPPPDIDADDDETPPGLPAGDRPAKGDWATPDSLSFLVNSINHDLGVQMTAKEFSSLAGISNQHDMNEWNEKYTTGKRAFEAVRSAWYEAVGQQEPAFTLQAVYDDERIPPTVQNIHHLNQRIRKLIDAGVISTHAPTTTVVEACLKRAAEKEQV